MVCIVIASPHLYRFATVRVFKINISKKKKKGGGPLEEFYFYFILFFVIEEFYYYYHHHSTLLMIRYHPIYLSSIPFSFQQSTSSNQPSRPLPYPYYII